MWVVARWQYRAVALAWVICALAAAPLHGGSIEDRDGKTMLQITVQGLPDTSDTSTATRADVEVLRAFIRQFPQVFSAKYRDKYKANPARYGKYNWDNVQIEVSRNIASALGDNPGNDLLSIAAGTAPEVIYMNFERSDNFIRNGFIAPLDLPQDGYVSAMSQEEMAFRVHPKIWPVIYRKGPDGRKHVWCLPYGGALGKVLLFRKDLFDARGLAHPTKDWTWDDLYSAARKLTDPQQGIYGIQVYTGAGEAWQFLDYLWSAGGDVMVYDEAKDQWRCAFDSPQAAVAMDFLLKLTTEKWIDARGRIRRGYAARDSEGGMLPDALWERGKIAMMFDYIDEKLFAKFNPEVTGMVPVPMGPTGIRRSEINCRSYALFSQIKDPAVRDAAWEFIRFYGSEEAGAIRTRIMVEGGLGQFVNPRYLKKFGYGELERLVPKGWFETFTTAVDNGEPEPYGRNSSLVYRVVSYPLMDAEELALSPQGLPTDRTKRLAVLQEMLRKGAARANEEMIGVVSPQERRKRDLTALAAIVAMAITFGLVFWKVIRTFAPPDDGLGTKKAKWGFIRYRWAYLLLVPSLLTIVLWQYVPLIRGSVMAFQDYKILGDSAWVGLQNFGDMLYYDQWWNSVWNAGRYSFLVMALTFMPPILLAILLQEVPMGKLLLRTIYYLPAVVTGLVTVLLWKQFYDPSETGVLNGIVMCIPAVVYLLGGVGMLVVMIAFAKRLWMHQMHLAAWAFLLAGLLLLYTVAGMAWPILFPAGESFLQSLAQVPGRLLATKTEAYRWLTDSDSAMVACVVPMVWAGVGPGCLIYLAALKGIPDDYYEAADIDGATFIDKIIFVVFPILKPLIIINFVGVFIGSVYGATENVLAMTGGAANTEVAGLRIWYAAFADLKYGPATAMAWMLGCMLIGFTIYQLKILSRVEFRTTGRKE